LQAGIHWVELKLKALFRWELIKIGNQFHDEMYSPSMVLKKDVNIALEKCDC